VTGRSLSIAAVVVAAFFLAAASAHAADTVYQYRIEHPTYGDIGTYSNVVKDLGDHIEIDTELHVAVKLLGIVVHREDATRSETWQGDRLVRFDGVTKTNGTDIKLHGEAKGDQFVITTPDGVITAPARVHPSNPWGERVLGTDMMMSAKNGRVEKVAVSAPVVDQAKFDGKELRLTRYDIVGSKHQIVWFDGTTPFAFRMIEDGTPIDFVLTNPPPAKAASNAQN
jgi:Family of unknown function (DUF6134)